MSEAQPINPAVEAHRNRSAEYVNIRDGLAERPEHFGMDVADLIGAKGDKLQPTEADRVTRTFSDVASPSDFYWAKSRITDDAGDFLGDVYLDEFYLECTQRVLGKLVTRKAEQFCEPLKQAVRSMREPLRTIAVSTIFQDEDPDSIARALSTSVETIDFLTQVALDFLATSIVPAGLSPQRAKYDEE
jgi:hypothetical protein